MQIVLAAVVLAELAFGTGFGLVRQALILLCGLLTVASAAAYLVAWLEAHEQAMAKAQSHGG